MTGKGLPKGGGEGFKKVIYHLIIFYLIGLWRYYMAEEKKSFSDFLVGLGVITTDQLKKASQEQKQRGERLEQTIVRLGYTKEELILQCLADYFNLPYVDLDTYLIDEKIAKTIPEEMARRHTLIPLFKIGNTLTVAMTNPLNIMALDEVRNTAKMDIEVVISTEGKVKRAIDQHYGATTSVLESTFKQLEKDRPAGPSADPLDYRKTHDLSSAEARRGAIDDAPAGRGLRPGLVPADSGR